MRFLLLLVLPLVLLGGCQDEPPAPLATKPAPAARGSFEAVTADALARALRAAEQLEKGARIEKNYGELREAVAESAPFFRLRAQLGSEALLGPPRASDEGGGALGALDAALRDGDRKRARAESSRVARALRLIDNEVSLHGIPLPQALQALSDACFELGLLLLEASPSAPSSPEAVLFELRGTLAAITKGARIAGEAEPKSAAPIAAALAKAKSARDLRDRAALVQASGSLGVTLRRIAKRRGVDVRLPYRARYPRAGNRIDEIITPFTLPAPRNDPRRGPEEGKLAALGQKLFFDRRLSREKKRACADCHRPDKAYSDGLPVPPTLDAAAPLLRNTPSLLYTSLNAAQLWDGQFASAERQALKVIHTAAEMGLSRDELTNVVNDVPEYRERFGALFDDGVTADNVARALVAFEVKELVPGSAPIDRFARGDNTALDARARAGLDVFASEGRCARCHVPPSFAGSRPADFATPVFAALGVPATPQGKELDGDEGRAKITRRPLDRGMFKTPTVRNAGATGPYFHHGRFATLEDVVDFYDKGGGRGLGLTVDNQDPDVRPLKLSPSQKADLLYFMRETLRDAK